MDVIRFTALQTSRLLLRKLMPSDWEMICFLRSDKKVNEFVDRPPAESKEEALAFISKIRAGNNNQGSYYWTITELDREDMIGSICLWNLSSDGQRAEVGYDLHPEYQGKGFMKESLKAVLDFGFQKLGLQVIDAYTHRLNEPSRKLLVACGFKLVEGKNDEDNENNVVYEIRHPATQNAHVIAGE
ncbi:MAG: GNAT family N-acetyltransferase [Saprospiraceae bacterium]|nr:GNAT family N-acetyltransferase [Saprospiraceae bacterium]